ncbi:hypothetical protein ACFWFK_30150 [Micromonospora chalcea]
MVESATLLLGRRTERQGRNDEARPYLRMAAAMSGDFAELGPSAAAR